MANSYGKEGFVMCACWNSHTTISCKRSGFIVFVVAAVVTSAVLLPYVGSTARRALPEFLPFISQAGGMPPMTGMLSVPLIAAAFIGFFTSFIFYESIHQRNVHSSKKIYWANRLALYIFLVCCLGCVVTAAFPIGYLDNTSKFDWAMSVLLGHVMGATMVLVGTCLYQFLLTFVWWFLPDSSKKAKFFKIALCGCYILMFFISAKPMVHTLSDILGDDPFNIELMKRTAAALPTIFDVNYQISAFCEWAVCILTAIQFLSAYYDMQRVSIRAVLRHKSCFMDLSETSSKSSSPFMS